MIRKLLLKGMMTVYCTGTQELCTEICPSTGILENSANEAVSQSRESLKPSEAVPPPRPS